MQHEVYLGLGGNIGDSLIVLRSALQQIEKLDVTDFRVSRFYHTQPISDIAQRWYINAACRFITKMGARQLLTKLQQIEIDHGKTHKPKNGPRMIDIDLLFFGDERHNSDDCEIPHPRWKERLFVVKPLSDLTTTVAIPGLNEGDNIEHVNLIELIQTFPNHALVKCVTEENYVSRSS